MEMSRMLLHKVLLLPKGSPVYHRPCSHIPASTWGPGPDNHHRILWRNKAPFGSAITSRTLAPKAILSLHEAAMPDGMEICILRAI